MTSSLQEHFELQEHCSSDASSFLFADSFVLPEPFKDTKILAYPIDNF